MNGVIVQASSASATSLPAIADRAASHFTNADRGLVSAEVAAPGGVHNVQQPQDSLPVFNVTRDLSGGFYEGGTLGAVKLTKSNALATALLAWSLLDAPQAYEDDPALTVRIQKVAFQNSWLGAFAPSSFVDDFVDLLASVSHAAHVQAKSLSILKDGVNYLQNCFIKDPSHFGSPEGDVYVYQVGSAQPRSESRLEQVRREFSELVLTCRI